MSLDVAPRYRRRTRWPIVVIVAVLALSALVVWSVALRPEPAEEAGCNEPGPPPAPTSISGVTLTRTSASSSTPTGPPTTLGKFIDPQTLASTRPADPARVPLRVLNASTVTGQAKTVTDELRAAGFTAMGQQDNDPLYPAADLRCYGEIRYGYAGVAEARTTLLVAPCAQLVLDDRLDNSVDLAIGRRYVLQAIPDEVKAQLELISQAAAPPPVIEGQTLSVRSLPPIPPIPDRSACPA